MNMWLDQLVDKFLLKINEWKSVTDELANGWMTPNESLNGEVTPNESINGKVAPNE
jgi:hypothetical protein